MIIKHIKTDPNAPKRQILGAMACVVGLASFGWLGAITAPLLDDTGKVIGTYTPPELIGAFA